MSLIFYSSWKTKIWNFWIPFCAKQEKKEVHETEDMSVIVKQLSTLGDVECLMQVLYLDGGTAKTVDLKHCV
jgi:hypothetical protein